MIEKIEDYMTEFPVLATEDMPVQEALRRMRDCGFRHLPVLHGKEVTGIVSERDLKQAEILADISASTVADYMTPRPYCVRLGTPMLEVVKHMSKHKYGSAIVISPSGKLAGIFTTTDALDLLTRLLDGPPARHMSCMMVDDYLSAAANAQD